MEGGVVQFPYRIRILPSAHNEAVMPDFFIMLWSELIQDNTEAKGGVIPGVLAILISGTVSRATFGSLLSDGAECFFCIYSLCDAVLS